MIQLSSIIDRVDGEMARLTDRTSKIGVFLDSVLDRLVDVAVIFAASILSFNNLCGV